MTSRAIISAAALLAACVVPAYADARIRKIDYEGWKGCYELSNPLVRVVVAPPIGGRIMEYSIQGDNVLWQNQVELGVVRRSDIGKKWHNYGGHKAWNAPQAWWRLPDADNFYDYAPALKTEVLPRCDNEDMAGIRVTCAPIPHLGFQFVREVYLSGRTSRVRVVERMKNVYERSIRWAPWGVTQVDAPCWVAFPINRASAFETGWKVMWPESGESKQISRVGNVGIVEYKAAVEKIGVDVMEGWMAYINGQLGYVKQWAVQTVGAAYPDGGCSAEIFTADAAMGGYVEMEVLGPLRALAPGEEIALTEDWFLTRLNADARDTRDVVERLKLMQKRGMLPRSTKLPAASDAP